MSRNAARFKDIPSYPSRVMSKIKLWITRIFPTLPFPKILKRSSFLALSALGFNGAPCVKRKLQLIKWTRPKRGWIKINVDGSSLGNPGPSGGGGVGKNSDGDFLFAFTCGFSFGSNSRAKIRAVWEGLSHCVLMGYSKVEIESDSKTIVDILDRTSSPSWALSYWWSRIKRVSKLLEVSISHIPREANAVADDLARRGNASHSRTLINSARDLPQITKGLIFLDRVGLGNLRKLIFVQIF